jgi:NAD(P)-dependent dehydrogenase (short-subunit alcohol dehydrogenase family)
VSGTANGNPSGELQGKRCLVTGATSGHGRAVAHALALRGADLTILGRSAAKCEEVRAEIEAKAGRPPEVLLCDLASRRDVARCADEFVASGEPLDLLVNNAGLVNLNRVLNDDGFEMTFAVNYLSMFHLTLRLLGPLQKSAPSRVVNIGSDSYRIGKLALDNLQLDRGYSVAKAYSNSKLAILHFTLELARRVEGTGVTVNTVDPGPVASNIGANNPGVLYKLAQPMIKYLFPSAVRAARTAVWVATDPLLADASGGYYRSLKHRDRPLGDEDRALSTGLWERSVEMTGVETEAAALAAN